MSNFCPNCGEEITEKVKFCPECGADISSFLKKSDDIKNIEEKKLEIKTANNVIEGEKIGTNSNKKDDNISLLCSIFIPGLGQLYNGDTYKGILIGICVVIAFLFSAPLAILIWVIGIADTMNNTWKINKGEIPFKPANKLDMVLWSILGLFVILAFIGFSLHQTTSNTNSQITSSYSTSSGNIAIIPPESPTQRNIRIAEEIVSNYHKSHTYSLSDLYVCGDMASDVWDMLKAQGINAKITVGNVDQDISKISDANHAWVMAEVAPNSYLALEATGGYSVQKTDNPRYYEGWSFYNPKQLKNYLQLSIQYNEAVNKYNAASNDYNTIVTQYNNAGLLTRISLKSQLDDKKLIFNSRTQDLNLITQQINSLLSSL